VPLFANNPLFSTPNFIGVGEDHGGIDVGLRLGTDDDDDDDESAEGIIGAVAAVVRGRA